MKMFLMLLVFALSTLALSGCASTCKKSCDNAGQSAPVASRSVVAAQPAAAPVADEIPAPVRKYVSK